MEEHKAELVWLYIGLHSVGCVGVIAILATVCISSKVRRYPTWFNFAISWIIFSVSFLLLFLGGQQTRPVPSYGLCLAQAGLVYASPVLCACTTLALVIQLWLHAVTVFSKKEVKIPVSVLILSPYLAFVSILLEALVVGLQDPIHISRKRGMYCSIDNVIPARVTSMLSIIVLVVILAFEGMIFHILFREWRNLQGRGAIRKRELLQPLVIRIVLFSVTELLAISVSGILFSAAPNLHDPAIIFLATMPLIFVLVFGTQEDILRSWMFWKVATSYEPINPRKLSL